MRRGEAGPDAGLTVPGTASPEAVLRTLLVSDLVGSTELVSRLGDQRAFQLFGRHDRVARDLLQAFGGREIDKTDGFLLLFERPFDAVRYAQGYHEALAALGEGEGLVLEARVGVHVGEVYLRQNPAEDVARGAKPLEVEGLAKAQAARLMSLAVGRQTLLGATAFDLARRAAVDGSLGERPLAWVAHGAYLLKGIEEPVQVFEVGVAGFSRLHPPPDSDKARRAVGDPTILGWRPAPGLQIPGRESFRLERKLGEGGFGEVWLAVHAKTRDRHVFKFCFEAEKLRGLQREVTLFRLLKETLGGRPDIARILDWSFEQAPYFLESEYSEGGSLAEWLDAAGGPRQVPLGQRLEVVAQTADALAAAHSVGVLHKDVKPANLLIAEDPDGSPRVRLTDFGIGTVTDTARLAAAGITALGLTAELGGGGTSSGTLLYMAPELLAGRPATLQADVYALGVLLYQLLVGDLGRAMGPGWERDVADPVLREDLAAMVDGSPERRLADAAEVARRLRGLDERRARREAEALALRAAERDRLALERLVRRRRVMLAVGAALVTLTVVATVQSRRVAREAERANREAETARAVSRFLVDVFEVTGPESGRGGTVTARELLDRAALRVADELSGRPLTRARLIDAMGTAYLQLGLYDRAEPLLQDARRLRGELLRPDDPEVASSLVSLGVLRTRQGRFDDAAGLLEAALAARERTLGREHLEVAVALDHLADLHRARGRHAEAQPLARRAEAIRRAAGNAAPSGPAEEGAGPAVLALRRVLDLPPDATRVVGEGARQGVAVVAATHGLYLLDLEGRLAPTLLPLQAGERVLVGVEGGPPLVRSGDRLLERDLFRPDGVVDRVLATRLPDDAVVATDRSRRRLAVAGDGRVRVLDLGSPEPRVVTEVTDAGPVQELAVSAHHVAWSNRDGVRVRSLTTATEVLRAADWEGRVTALALDDSGSLLAVAGWFDEVLVYDLASGARMDVFSLPGQTGSLLFLPDLPSLVVAKEGGLAVWRPGEGVVARHEEPGAELVAAGWGPAGLLVHDGKGRRLLLFDYGSVPLDLRLRVSSQALWAACADAETGGVFLGSAEGQVHRLDPSSGDLRSVQAHTQGVTAVTVRDGRLVSASDDKTLAVWDAATLQPLQQSKAHSFLVNFLFWEEGSDTLWSSSSDGTLKAWTWPGLVESEVIFPDPSPKAAFWVDRARGLALVGTWDGRWLELERRGGGWEVVRRQATGSSGVYSVAELPGAAAVLLLGVRPSSLWVFDLERRDAWPVPLPGVDLGWVVPLAPDRAALVGTACVATLEVEREGGGLSYRLSVGLSTAAGDLGVAALVPGSGRLAAGNAAGEVVLLDPSRMQARPLVSGRLGR